MIPDGGAQFEIASDKNHAIITIYLIAKWRL
ncbi:hypothetical protein KCQ_12370 [Pectobacterium atrosepticum ICMP 1526]|nr:hypothetical protein KCQ_12370 [Pectobacterium atrosepticum ICMP 1526]